MTVIAFTPKVPPPKDRRYKVTLRQDNTRVLCQILPGGDDRHWQCWIRLNGKPAFAQRTDEAALLDQIAALMAILVAALRAAGWTED